MKKQFCFLLLLSSILFSFLWHPIYISTTEIDYNKSEKSLEIAIKVFSDDLEKALTKAEGSKIEIGTDREHEQATKYIEEYIKRHFRLKVNGRAVDMNYINRKLVREDFFAIWVLFSVSKVNKIKTLNLMNNILIDLHEGQQNFVKFRESKDSRYARKVASKGNVNLVLK